MSNGQEISQSERKQLKTLHYLGSEYLCCLKNCYSFKKVQVSKDQEKIRKPGCEIADSLI